MSKNDYAGNFKTPLSHTIIIIAVDKSYCFNEKSKLLRIKRVSAEPWNAFWWLWWVCRDPDRSVLHSLPWDVNCMQWLLLRNGMQKGERMRYSWKGSWHHGNQWGSRSHRMPCVHQHDGTRRTPHLCGTLQNKSPHLIFKESQIQMRQPIKHLSSVLQRCGDCFLCLHCSHKHGGVPTLLECLWERNIKSWDDEPQERQELSVRPGKVVLG